MRRKLTERPRLQKGQSSSSSLLLSSLELTDLTIYEQKGQWYSFEREVYEPLHPFDSEK